MGSKDGKGRGRTKKHWSRQKHNRTEGGLLIILPDILSISITGEGCEGDYL